MVKLEEIDPPKSTFASIWVSSPPDPAPLCLGASTGVFSNEPVVVGLSTIVDTRESRHCLDLTPRLLTSSASPLNDSS